MRFHANENIEAEVVEFLRGLGHDVTYAAEIQPRASDEEVLARATREGRILITSDKDFGELCFVQGRPSRGVLLIRSRDVTAQGRIRLVQRFLKSVPPSESPAFVVVSDGAIRKRTLPRRPQ